MRGNQVSLVGQLDFDDDFTHVQRVPDPSTRRKDGMKD